MKCSIICTQCSGQTCDNSIDDYNENDDEKTEMIQDGTDDLECPQKCSKQLGE